MTKIGKILYNTFVKHPEMKERLEKLVDKGLTVKELQEHVDVEVPCYLLFPDPARFGCEGCDLKCAKASMASQKLKKHPLKEVIDKTHLYKHLEVFLRPRLVIQV
ncbi:conserved hypothetical protein [Methanothermobacter sp. MT-2]|nr:conserved hypothetical protein [Methanothermobacter sp. MT-2]